MENRRINVARSSMPTYDEYIEMIKPLWETRRLTNMGEYHKKLEEELKLYLGIPEISLMVNGHMALEMTIQAMNFPKGSEIITTPFTFISTTHAIIRNGLIPVFCDIKSSDYTIDETKIESKITEKTVAILPVHVYGNICAVNEIQKIADLYKLKVIYDAAHSFAETLNGEPVEKFGDASVLSFHATKVFNTIEGGAVCFSGKQLYKRLYNLKNFGIQSEEIVEEVGANAKMNEFSAIMGLCNLKHFEAEREKRKKLSQIYDNKLQGIVKINDRNKDIEYNYGYYPVVFNEADGQNKRDLVYKTLMEKQIYSRKYFYPITSDQICFGDKYKKLNLQIARSISNRVLVLPLYAELDEEEIDLICNTVTHILI